MSFLTDLDGCCVRKTPKSVNIQEVIHLEVGHHAGENSSFCIIVRLFVGRVSKAMCFP